MDAGNFSPMDSGRDHEFGSGATSKMINLYIKTHRVPHWFL